MYGEATISPTAVAGSFVSLRKTSPISSGALAHVSKMHIKDVTEIRAEDFPLSHFRERIGDIVGRLEHGLGLVLLRGLPIYDRFSEDEATIIYWGMGRHMGNLVPQNRKGDLVGTYATSAGAARTSERTQPAKTWGSTQTPPTSSA
jgi:hypothetical protein